MLEIKENSRQVPKEKQICADKRYYDILYAWLQCASVSDGAERIVAKKDVKFSQLSQVLNLSRQTVSKKFNNLIEMGLVEKKENGDYLIKRLDNTIASLVPYKTLKLITDTLNEHSINTYVYLFNRYLANNCQGFVFTLAQIKENIGICATTQSNDETVTNILFVLDKLGLIKYRLELVVQDNTTFGNVKNIHKLEWLTNEIC